MSFSLVSKGYFRGKKACENDISQSGEVEKDIALVRCRSYQIATASTCPLLVIENDTILSEGRGIYTNKKP